MILYLTRAQTMALRSSGAATILGRDAYPHGNVYALALPNDPEAIRRAAEVLRLAPPARDSSRPAYVLADKLDASRDAA